MLQVLANEICEKLAKADVIAVSIDESAAIDNTEYLSIIVYFPNRDGMLEVAFAELVELKQMDAGSITKSVVSRYSVCTYTI